MSFAFTISNGASQLPRRRRGWWQNSSSSNKRQKKSSVADELVCPISLELPFEPVTADDGRVYERSAISMYFTSSQNNDREIKSPVTNEPMGMRLLPSPQIKNIIQTLVETGTIEGDLAEHWKKKQQANIMSELLQKAEDGDPDSMYKVGCNYRWGEHGFKKDKVLANQWFVKAHEEGVVKATARVGYAQLKGPEFGVPKNKVMGIALLTMAGERGSDVAAFYLGLAFARGMYGLPIDTKQAEYWLGKCSSGSCKHKHTTKKQMDSARVELENIKFVRADCQSAHEHSTEPECSGGSD